MRMYLNIMAIRGEDLIATDAIKKTIKQPTAISSIRTSSKIIKIFIKNFFITLSLIHITVNFVKWEKYRIV
jgi:hypothetical protein